MMKVIFRTVPEASCPRAKSSKSSSHRRQSSNPPPSFLCPNATNRASEDKAAHAHDAGGVGGTSPTPTAAAVCV